MNPFFTTYELQDDNTITKNPRIYKRVDNKPVIYFRDGDSLVYGYDEDLYYRLLRIKVIENIRSIKKFFDEQIDLRDQAKLGDIL